MRDLLQERQIGALNAENAGLVEEILELRTNPRSIERLAREQLGLSGRDEMVFVIRPNPPPRTR